MSRLLDPPLVDRLCFWLYWFWNEHIVLFSPHEVTQISHVIRKIGNLVPFDVEIDQVSANAKQGSGPRTHC